MQDEDDLPAIEEESDIVPNTIIVPRHHVSSSGFSLPVYGQREPFAEDDPAHPHQQEALPDDVNESQEEDEESLFDVCTIAPTKRHDHARVHPLALFQATTSWAGGEVNEDSSALTTRSSQRRAPPLLQPPPSPRQRRRRDGG